MFRFAARLRKRALEHKKEVNSGMANLLSDSPSRQDALEFLFESSSYGNLGLFIGAGFSKAIFADEEEDLALSWGELLEKASKKMGMKLDEFKRDGSSFPEVASALCAAFSHKSGEGFEDAVLSLKQTLGDLTAWFPPEPARSKYSSYLKAFAPSWIITTNYDQILECLLPGNSVSLGPNDSFVSRKGITPIFHLHGVRTRPSELIISQEDYVSLFRPNEYRQIRLALAMRESTTCFLGYGLGDVNVLTALDWSKNVFKDERANFPRDVIQVLRKKNPESTPRRLGNGVLVIETEEIASFFDEYLHATEHLQKRRENLRRRLKRITRVFGDAESDDVDRFIDDSEWRHDALRLLQEYGVDIVAEFEIFLGKVFKETKRRSGKQGAFNAYSVNLEILLDLLKAFKQGEMPPALFAATVANFGRLALYIGDEFGSSWAAKSTWDKRRNDLDKSTVAELRVIAKQYRYTTLTRLLKGL